MWIRTQFDELIELTGMKVYKPFTAGNPNEIRLIRTSSSYGQNNDELIAEYKTEYECDLVFMIFQQALLMGVSMFSFERKVTTELIKKYADKYDIDLSELDL